MKEFLKTTAKVREFIWEHWKLKKQGKIKLEVYSKEGERSISNYQIECNEDKNCKLLVEIERELIGRYKFRGEKFTQFHQFTTNTIDRVNMPKDSLSKRKTVPDNLVRSADSYLIRLKTEDGKVVEI